MSQYHLQRFGFVFLRWYKNKKQFENYAVSELHQCLSINQYCCLFLMKLSISPPANVRTDEFYFQWSGHVPDRLALMLFCNTRPRYGLRCGSSSDPGKNVLAYVLNKTWSTLDLSYLVRWHMHFFKLCLSWAEWKQCIRNAFACIDSRCLCIINV